jgi:hypothetical protein
MQLLSQYIQGFLAEPNQSRNELGQRLLDTQAGWDVIAGQNPVDALDGFVDRYNWLGTPANKATYNITQNLARNLPGAMMQDFLIHLVLHTLVGKPPIDVFTEVRVGFGSYPLWDNAVVTVASPAQVADVAVGYKFVNGVSAPPVDPNPRAAISVLLPGESVVPLIVINSKIRVSQSEFFDWLGRDQLLAKGYPSCLSLQAALRAEMDLKIVEAAQASDKFFLLGHGGEANVVPDPEALARLVQIVEGHLTKHLL